MCEILQVIYGLPQAVIITNKILTEGLTKHGYCRCEIKTGLWKNDMILFTFFFTVHDVGVKYVGKENVTLIVDVIQHYYNISVDWEVHIYCGLTLDWYY